MNNIWWEKISRARYFVEDVADTVLEGKSIVLNLPEFIPWQETMYLNIEEKLSMESPEFRLVFVDCPSDNAGEFLLENFCKREKRHSYRYGQSYAVFLAKSTDIVLNSSYIWVKGVYGKKLDEWVKFIQEYNKNVPKGAPKAVFVLETHDVSSSQASIKGMRYLSFDEQIDSYDKFTFCALASTESDIKGYLRPYLADLVSTICQDDIELCATCIDHWSDFLSDPVATIQKIMDSECHSNGSPFYMDLNPTLLDTRIWEGQVKLLFPLVERYRSKFIKRHIANIKKALPITTYYGEIIDDPLDVEIGFLIQMAAKKELVLSPTEYTQLCNFRHARNDLAHTTPIEFDRVDWLLSQKI